MICKTEWFLWISGIPEDFSVQSDFQTSSQCVTVPPCLEIAKRCWLYPCSGSLWSQGSLFGLGVILLLHVETWSWDCRWTWRLSFLPIRDSRARSAWGLPWCNISLYWAYNSADHKVHWCGFVSHHLSMNMSLQDSSSISITWSDSMESPRLWMCGFLRQWFSGDNVHDPFWIH